MIAAVAATSDPALATIYPVVVLVTTVTALIVPYSIKYTDRVTRSFEGRVPKPLLLMASYLNLVVTNLRRRSRSSVHISNEMRNNISTLFVNIVVVISVLVLVLSVVPRVPDYAYLVGGSKYLLLLIVVTASVLLIIPAMKSIWVRSIRLVEVSTSEAMLSTKSAETMGYNATAKALRWSLLGLYIFIGFIIVAPVMHSMIQENLMFAIIAVVVIAVVVLALWSSIQAINSKLSEVFEHRGTISVADTSSDLAEIEEIIAAMERERR
jgi:sensor histidine kinase YesM